MYDVPMRWSIVQPLKIMLTKNTYAVGMNHDVGGILKIVQIQ